VTATDVAPEALALAARNADRLGLAVSVVAGDLFSGVDPSLRGTVDLVVCNPPYVEPHELRSLPADVRADPEVALAGGVEVYRRLFGASLEWLRPGGSVVVEIGERRGDAVSAAAADAGLLEVRVLPDLVGRDRVVVGRRP